MPNQFMPTITSSIKKNNKKIIRTSTDYIYYEFSILYISFKLFYSFIPIVFRNM